MSDRIHASYWLETPDDPARAAEVISLTYFAGMEREEIAKLMEVSASTIDRALRFGRAWLKDALREREPG